ncbi:MAG: UDP-N-acetylmuramoyl-L-alanyl-D-glutamate--2,6-diaminopimelate ligase [Fibrobacteraceae bacterium]|nr:UDP-N-acetylmuramoyl-L-alanyl-D-glutamate--2,6-diaminopimelate ligase [Fibrobacteraceae bacterium]
MLSEALFKNLGVKGLCDDSRKATAGDLFFALPGEGSFDFARSALSKGAIAIVGECEAPLDLASKWIQVKNVKDARLEAAKIFFKDPFSKLIVHAVTGTNGKTTSAFLMESVLRGEGRKAALVGTICKKIGDKVISSNLTTPGLLELHAFAAEAALAGCTDFVMEASSHSLDQGRVAGIAYKSALFSNLTEDHLDYHKTMEAYFEAKKLLFTKYLAQDGVAVINIDDAYGKRLFNEISVADKVSVSRLGADFADVKPASVKSSEDGLVLDVPSISSRPIETPLVGDFNADNVLLVAAWAHAMHFSEEALRTALSTIMVPGRFEMVFNDGNRRVIVDYAHTPDALERVLRTARSLCKGKLSVVFGCGGDRDRNKRHIMGAIAEREADFAWVTSDNPRTEKPEDIIAEIVSGMTSKNFEVIVSREEAIAKACHAMQRGDFLVVAGKGHENYQIVGKVKHHFDDHEIVLREMK